MCDYSLENVVSRPAVVGETLGLKMFPFGSKGFCSPGAPGVAVCLRPGTVVNVHNSQPGAGFRFTQATFVKHNEWLPNTHHDALQFPDNRIVLLQQIEERDFTISVVSIPVEQRGEEVFDLTAELNELGDPGSDIPDPVNQPVRPESQAPVEEPELVGVSR